METYPRSVTFIAKSEEEFQAILAGKAKIVETKSDQGSTYEIAVVHPEVKPKVAKKPKPSAKKLKRGK